MNFTRIQQTVLQIEDIKTLVESIKIETKDNFCVVFNLEAHANRLLKSILELGFNLPSSVQKEEFTIFLLNQIKNKLQYEFNSQVMFTDKKGFPKADIYKLRLVYKQSGNFEIEINKYTRDLSKTWKVRILNKEEFHIESTNPIWQHKFLPRPDFSYYLDQGYDEVIWLDENNLVCEGSFTAIVLEDGNFIKSPKANTLPSTSLIRINPEFEEIAIEDLNSKKFKLVNSMISMNNIEIY